MHNKDVLLRIELAKKQNLTELSLQGFKLKELPPELFKLVHLTKLNLATNKLTSLPPEIVQLKNLRALNVSGNQLRFLPKEIGQLGELRRLTISSNPIEKLPIQIGQLKNLQRLEANNCNLLILPEQFCQLTNLVAFRAKNNQLRQIPEQIGNLSNLVQLDLSGNQLRELPKQICQLDGLQGVYYKGANKTEPAWRLKLGNNPLKIPPIEVADNFELIKQYFTSLEIAQSINYLYEAKLILVGEGRVGKTALTKTLINPGYTLENELTTEGIDIVDWNISIDKLEHAETVNLHIWDFGGQEIYHATHQFFLTTRSIYLYVLETRRDESLDNFYYWLNIIKLLGGDSPVIVIVNKCDQPTDEYDIEEFKKFNKNVIDLKIISCLTKQGIPNLITSIKDCIRSLKHLGTPLDERWIKIRKQLEYIKNHEQKDYISREEFDTICQENGLTSYEIKGLSDIFHSLGIFIHFQYDQFLRDIVILNPEWATQGVYKILDSKTNNGHFTAEYLDTIWGNELKYKYNQAALIALMKKFELCFELKQGNEYIAPQLLSKKVSKYQWRTVSENLFFEFRYDFMPKGIISKFIVKRHEDIYKETYWRYGVLLEWNDTRAIVTEEYHQKKIQLILAGKEKKHFLAIIRKTFYEIHNHYQDLVFYEYIGCTCSKCKQSQEPFFFDLNNLKKAKNSDIKKIQCQNSYENISLLNLIDKAEEIQDTTRCLVFTEDEKIDLCKEVLKISGFYMNETEIHSYKGKANLNAAIVATDILKENKYQLQYIIFHVDRDVDDESDEYLQDAIAKLNKRDNIGDIKYILFLTLNYDLEAYFINASHISSLSNGKISIEQAEILINQATDETESASLKRLFERMEKIREQKHRDREKLSYYQEIENLKEMYNKNKERYRYGKKVLSKLRGLIQEKYKLNIELIQKSEYIEIPNLKFIADNIW